MSFRHGNKVNVRHGMTRTPTHRSWMAMIGRCTTPSDGSYARYGGRGIAVCERWRVFESFLADMGERPSKDHSIERRNVNGHYEPGNCYWATSVEQRRNRRCTVLEAHEPAQIRWLASLGYTHQSIADHFDVMREVVSKVVRNEQWADPNYTPPPFVHWRQRIALT